MLRQITVFEQVPLAIIKKIIKAERMPKPKFQADEPEKQPPTRWNTSWRGLTGASKVGLNNKRAVNNLGVIQQIEVPSHRALSMGN